jgi:hypothetical protein
MILDRYSEEGQHPWLQADRSLDLFFQCRLVAVELSGIDFEFRQPHETSLPGLSRGASAGTAQAHGKHRGAQEEKLSCSHGELLLNGARAASVIGC